MNSAACLRYFFAVVTITLIIVTVVLYNLEKLNNSAAWYVGIGMGVLFTIISHIIHKRSLSIKSPKSDLFLDNMKDISNDGGESLEQLFDISYRPKKGVSDKTPLLNDMESSSAPPVPRFTIEDEEDVESDD